MANKETLTKTATDLGIEVDSDWTNKQIKEAIQAKELAASQGQGEGDGQGDGPGDESGKAKAVSPDRLALLASAGELKIEGAEGMDTAALRGLIDDAQEDRLLVRVPKAVTTTRAIVVKAGDHRMTKVELAACGLEERHYEVVDEDDAKDG